MNGRLISRATVLRLIVIARTGALTPDKYLEDFDADAYDGRGYVQFTADKSRAKRFSDTAAALQFLRTQSTTHPLRPDGKPNRPLTAHTWMIDHDETF
jgi:hypothetical protein